MKILLLHCDFIKFKALKKALKSAKDLSENEKKEMNVKDDPLVVLSAVEKGDENVSSVVSEFVKNIEDVAGQVKAKHIVLYPYAHLSSNLSNPQIAVEVFEETEKELVKKKYKVTRAPFGYYKEFELKVKGHPLSELSRSFGASGSGKVLDEKQNVKKGTSKGEESVDPNEVEQLVKKLSRVNMSAPRGKDNLKSNVELGKDLEIYIVNEVVGQGLPLLTPYGATIKREIERFAVDEELRRGYLHTATPVMAKSDLFKVSGHWQHYQDSMFCIHSGDDTLALRPMTCPFHFILYKSKPRSYRELPLKYAEIANLFRNEQSGELRGLTRVRQFTLADAHIVCRKDQVEEQFEEVLDLLKYSMKVMGVKDIWYRFSKWDPKDKKKYIDNPKAWEESQALMKKILDKLKVKYIEAPGEAAFYGPKLDLQYKDVYGKEDTLLTIQIDFALPERYDMTYTDENNESVRPLVIHRSSTGATERLIAYLLEKTQGALPVWLSPVQVKVLNFTDRNTKGVEKFAKKLNEEGIRVESDLRSEPLGGKVRDAELMRIPYIITIGDREEKDGSVSVRLRGDKKLKTMKQNEFIEMIKGEVGERK